TQTNVEHTQPGEAEDARTKTPVAATMGTPLVLSAPSDRARAPAMARSEQRWRLTGEGRRATLSARIRPGPAVGAESAAATGRTGYDPSKSGAERFDRFGGGGDGGSDRSQSLPAGPTD